MPKLMQEKRITREGLRNSNEKLVTYERAVAYLRGRAAFRDGIYGVDSKRDYSISESMRILNTSARYIESLTRDGVIKLNDGLVDGSSLLSLCRDVASGLEKKVARTDTPTASVKRSEEPAYGSDNGLATYLRDIKHSTPLSKGEEVEYMRRIRRGDTKARDMFVEDNLRFVITVAKGYQGLGLSLLELISEGNLGLMKAVEKFDETRGFKFISYAVWWIRQSILQKLTDSRSVRVPMSVHNDYLRYSSVIRDLEDGKGTDNPWRLVEDVADRLWIDPERVEHTFLSTQTEISLDHFLIDDEPDNTFLDILPDDSQEAPDESANRDSVERRIRECMQDLDKREVRILGLYFGLNGERPFTLDEIGEMYELTRERIRQIKEKALGKMRHPSRLRVLAECKDYS